MNEFTTNSQIYAIATENEISNILSHFSSEYIMDIINDNLNKRLSYTMIPNPNIVNSFESNFRNLLSEYPFGSENIKDVREATYKEIINILCNYYNLQFNDTGDIDYFTAASCLYEFLISNFISGLTNFFCAFIISEKDNLYASLELENLKKNKDSSTTYNKKIYQDQKLAIINSNIYIVLNQIATYGINLYDIIRTIYPHPDIYTFFENIISDNGDFYKTAYIALLNDEYSRPNLITNIRLTLQQYASNGHTIISQEGGK